MPVEITSTRLALLFVLIALASISTAWGFELIGGYVPCPLCLQQRIPYYAAIPVGAVTAYLAARGMRGPATIGFVLLLFIMAIGAGLGIYHSGVEWKWWEGPASCGGAGDIPLNAGNLLNQLGDVTVVACNEAPWRMFGLSFAGWNVVISIGLAAIALAGCGRYGSSSASQ